MKKSLLAFLLLFTALIPTLAQQPRQQGGGQRGNQPGQQAQQPRFDPQEFTKRMEGYISMKAGLTKEEAEKFFPIYREFKAKQRDLTFKQQRLKREKPANDKEYENTLNQIASLSVQISKLEQTYLPKMCKVIPAKKVYLVLQAEDDFHRDMVRQPQWGRMPGVPGQQPQQWRGGNGNGQPQWGGQQPQRRQQPQQQ